MAIPSLRSNPWRAQMAEPYNYPLKTGDFGDFEGIDDTQKIENGDYRGGRGVSVVVESEVRVEKTPEKTEENEGYLMEGILEREVKEQSLKLWVAGKGGGREGGGGGRANGHQPPPPPKESEVRTSQLTLHHC
uniref:Uncharacterized protein n=1 Tax=Opuntia streptacantha TaxID=393608 RepID=A0A7C9DMA9_OPUST